MNDENKERDAFVAGDYAIWRAIKMDESDIGFTIELDAKSALAFYVAMNHLLALESTKKSVTLYTLIFTIYSQIYHWFVRNDPLMGQALEKPQAEIELSEEVTLLDATAKPAELPIRLVFRGADAETAGGKGEWLDECGQDSRQYDVHGRVWELSGGEIAAIHYRDASSLSGFSTRNEAKEWLLNKVIDHNRFVVLAAQKALAELGKGEG